MLEEAWKQTVAQIDALADEGRFDEASTRLRNLEFLRPPNGEDADLFARFHLRWAETVEADEPLVAIRLLTIARRGRSYSVGPRRGGDKQPSQCTRCRSWNSPSSSASKAAEKFTRM